MSKYLQDKALEAIKSLPAGTEDGIFEIPECKGIYIVLRKEDLCEFGVFDGIEYLGEIYFVALKE